MAHVSVVRSAIEPAEVLGSVGAPAHGAALLFLGVVRDHADGRPVTGMRYDAYEDMASSILAEIAREAEAIAGGGSVAVVHRIGDLDVGDVSVAVAVSSPHRAEAYAASRHVIEEIKRRLPVWKKERYADGAQEWVPGADPPAPGRSGRAGGGGP